MTIKYYINCMCLCVINMNICLHCVFKASKNKRTTYCNLLVAEDQLVCMFLRVIPFTLISGLIHCVSFGGISSRFSLISPRLALGQNNIGWIHGCKSILNSLPPSLKLSACAAEMIVDNLIEELVREENRN